MSSSRETHSNADFQLKAPARRYPERLVFRMIRVLTGLTLLEWLSRAIARTLGFRSHIAVSVDAQRLKTERTFTWFGKIIRKMQTVERFSEINAAGCVGRFPTWNLMLGVSILALSVALGGIWFADGVRSKSGTLIVMSALVIMIGALLDLVLDVAAPTSQGRTTLYVNTTHVRVAWGPVAFSEAHQFLDHVSMGMHQTDLPT